MRLASLIIDLIEAGNLLECFTVSIKISGVTATDIDTEPSRFLSPSRRLVKVISTTLGSVLAIRGLEKSGKTTQADLHRIMVGWGEQMLEGVGCRKTLIGTPSQVPSLFVGNHISYVDIPLLMSCIPVAFVAKKQLASWPLFGSGMRGVGTVFVDRDSRESRKNVSFQIGPRIVKDRQSIVVFPSGTTTVDESKPWRHGPFQIAKLSGVPVQPFRIRYHPVKKVAFILDDAFVGHLWGLLRHGEFLATIEFHEPVMIGDPVLDSQRWWDWVRG